MEALSHSLLSGEQLQTQGQPVLQSQLQAGLG